MSFKVLRSQSGFSLLQVLIAVGLTALVSILLAQVASSLTGIQQRARVETELMDLVEDSRRILIRSDACANTLATAGVQIFKTEPKFPMIIQSIKDEGNNPVFFQGQKFANDFLTIREIKGELSKDTPVWKENSLVVIDLTILVDVNGVNFGPSNMVKHFALTVETGPSKELVACNSLDLKNRLDFENAVCDTIGGTLYNGICDLKKSTSLIKAACESMGLTSKGDHCE